MCLNASACHIQQPSLIIMNASLRVVPPHLEQKVCSLRLLLFQHIPLALSDIWKAKRAAYSLQPVTPAA